jgi:hypothetical protein
MGFGLSKMFQRHTPEAALGNVTVTLRGTSGSIVHTADLPFTIVDQLPPLDPACL